LSATRIIIGIPRTFILVFAGAAAAVAASLPGTPAAAPAAGHAVTAASRSLATRAATPPGHATPAILAITVIPARPATARPATARYTLTAATRRLTVPLTPRQLAWRMLARFGWPHWQFRYLDLLWDHESGWDPRAANPYSEAYGIPQADPGSQMAAAGPDWRWSARTQIRWGLSYIQQRYGSPLSAWSHENWAGWY
jgi:hypothetical protein